jgi:CHASE3 domain sensor protein
MPNNPFEYLEIVKKTFPKIDDDSFYQGWMACQDFWQKKEATQQSVQRTGSRLVRFVLIFGWVVLLIEVIAIIAIR